LIAQGKNKNLSLLHQDVSGWKVLVPGAPALARPTVSWAGPGEAFASGFYPDRILHYVAHRASEEPLDLPSGEGVAVVRHLGRFGTVAATNLGHMFRRNPLGGWDPIPSSPLAIAIDTFAPYGNGFLVGANSSLVVEYDPVQQFCTPMAVGGGTVWELEPFGDQFVARTSNFADEMRPATVLFLTLTVPTPPSDPCAQ
jgi:hypothetical protein